MSRISTKKVSTLALLTSAVFTISSLAPIEFAPGPFSPDAAFAKSEKANGGNRGGNGNGNAGGNSGGKGGEKSASSGGNSGNNGGGKGVGNNGGGKGVGGSFAKATQRGGNLVKSVFGRGKAKVKTQKVKTQRAAIRATTPKVKPKDLLAAMGYHPSDVKGWNGVFHANPNAAKHASVNSKHGLAAAFFAQQISANTAAATAQTAADAYAAALGAVDLASIVTTLTGADYDAAVAALAEQRLTELESALVTANSAIPVDPLAPDYATAVAAADAIAAEIAAWTEVASTQTAAQDLQQIADQEQAEAVSAFEAVTPNVEYSTQKAIDFYSMVKDNEAMVQRVNGIVEADALAAEAAAAEAAAAEAAAAEGEVVLLDGNGDTFTLAVQ